MITYREPVPADAEGITRVLRESWAVTYSQWLTPEWFEASTDAWADSWRATLERAQQRRAAGEPDPARRWIALDGDLIIGVSNSGRSAVHGAFEPAREVLLGILYVDEEYHGTGVGSKLLELALPDGAPAELWVADPNPRAQAFYRRHGFEPDGARQINERLANTPELRMVR
ncbi:Predicted N-acetyltransferase YhbS [Ruaniaceae bacterium KH17]|nr:Predicted N-acetyltransferase YhbS [Ruaniaceae bacterium KH17]